MISLEQAKKTIKGLYGEDIEINAIYELKDRWAFSLSVEGEGMDEGAIPCVMKENGEEQGILPFEDEELFEELQNAEAVE